MRRDKFRQGLHRLYLPIYDALCEQLPAEWEPYFGRRTLEEQRELFEQGRSRPGKIVTRARPGTSPHNWGCASDWTIFVQGNPVWQLPPSEWALYGDVCRRAGASWGGDWVSFKDRPHNELPIRVSWAKVGDHWEKTKDEPAVYRFIEGNRMRR